MIIHSTTKQTFGILGLPRSGTTLLGNLFHSADNAFCFSEPIWLLETHKMTDTIDYSKIEKKHLYDKVSDFECKRVGDMPSEVKKHIKSSPKYQLGGIKETYRSFNKGPAYRLFGAKEIDFFMFIFREPKYCYDSWKRSGWEKEHFHDPKVFVQSYKELFEVSLQLRRRRPCILISYEQLAENIHILNEKLKGFCTFDFSNFSIKPTEFLFGDAQKDEITDIAQIKNNNRSYELVSEKELHIINNELNSIYQRVVVDKEKDPKLYRKVRNIIIK